MARVYMRADVSSALWYLIAPEGSNVVELRKRGKYGGYSTLEELRVACEQFSKPAFTERLGHTEQAATGVAAEAAPAPAPASSLAAQPDEEAGSSLKFLAGYFVVDAENSVVTLANVPVFPKETSRVYQVKGDDPSDPEKTIVKEFKSWRVDFGGTGPTIMVRVGMDWLELRNPIKLYVTQARSLFVTLQLVNFIVTNPETTSETAWAHVRGVFSHTDLEKEFQENLELVRTLRSTNPEVEKSSLIEELLRPPKKKRRKYRIVEPEEEEDEVGVAPPPMPVTCGFGDDSICVICDDGGTLLCCEGPCMRSFHATYNEDSTCPSLNLSDYDPVKDKDVPFFCGNCSANLQQCFACGKLGKSQGPKQEVFLCDVALCGRFYHLNCGARADGFACRLHTCSACGGNEQRDPASMLYPCRRCPRAWHRACLSPDIKFTQEEAGPMGVVRGWYVAKSRFIYCMDHEICPETGTPTRNHLDFKTLRACTFKRENLKHTSKDIQIKLRSTVTPSKDA